MGEPGVTVELFGLARHRAGRPDLTVAGRTIADLLRAVSQACPALRDLVDPDGTISRQFLVSVNGERFVLDTTEAVPAGSRLLILGADAGG